MNSWKENIDKFHFADVRNFNAFDLTDKYLSSGRANMESDLSWLILKQSRLINLEDLGLNGIATRYPG